jgi:hypothetical protein
VIVGGVVVVLACISESARRPVVTRADSDDYYHPSPGWDYPYYAHPSRPGEEPVWYAPGTHGIPSQVFAGGEHRGRGPRGYRRPDADIRADICERMTEDAHLDASDIDVRVRDGEVTLDGTVTSRQARRRAEEMCDSSSGVREVVNRLEVTNPAAGPGARRVA